MLTLSPTAIDWYACIRDDLTAVERIVDKELLSSVPQLNELTQVVRSYRGKMLRPALLLLAGRAVGELKPAHYTLAAVVEIVHMATLVHDDVIDVADERRRQPSVRKLAGNVAAVLLGDYCISHAFHLCSSLDSQHASRRIGATTTIVCEGELLQNLRRADDTLSEAEYLEIVERKTGTLTAVACELGAFFGGARPGVIQALYAYGLAAGTAFQIVDDVLDITGDSGAVGKTLGLDFLLGKLTLPTLHALAHAAPGEARWLREAFGGLRGCSREELRSRLEATGSIDYALSAARSHVLGALGQLDCLPVGEAKAALAAAAEFILQRRA